MAWRTYASGASPLPPRYPLKAKRYEPSFLNGWMVQWSNQ